ncbi:hypothetical protein ACFL1E_07615 [Candidatus Omnitrophota bacterium]
MLLSGVRAVLAEVPDESTALLPEVRPPPSREAHSLRGLRSMPEKTLSF